MNSTIRSQLFEYQIIQIICCYSDTRVYIEDTNYYFDTLKSQPDKSQPSRKLLFGFYRMWSSMKISQRFPLVDLRVDLYFSVTHHWNCAMKT